MQRVEKQARTLHRDMKLAKTHEERNRYWQMLMRLRKK